MIKYNFSIYFYFWLKYFSYHKQIQEPFLNQISTVIPFKTVSE